MIQCSVSGPEHLVQYGPFSAEDYLYYPGSAKEILGSPRWWLWVSGEIYDSRVMVAPGVGHMQNMYLYPCTISLTSEVLFIL